MAVLEMKLIWQQVPDGDAVSAEQALDLHLELCAVELHSKHRADGATGLRRAPAASSPGWLGPAWSG
jgi:hypothetical protein